MADITVNKIKRKMISNAESILSFLRKLCNFVIFIYYDRNVYVLQLQMYASLY